MRMLVTRLRSRSLPLALHLLCILLSATCLWFSDAQKNEPYAMRISCGAREDVTTAPTNTLWYRDFGYTGGKLANASRPSFIMPPLTTLRYFPLSDGPENCYNIDNIPNGHYEVRIFFALNADSSIDGEPIFDISIEGTQIYSLKSGWSNSDEESFTEALVFVRNSSILVCFHSTGHGDPSILSIEILQVDDKSYDIGPSKTEGMILRAAKRLACGTEKSAFDEDYSGNHWGGDRFWLGINSFDEPDKTISTVNSISQTSIAPNFYPEKLYQSAIVGTDLQPDLQFQMEVEPNKKYSIWFHFAEIDAKVSSKEQRVFDILINGDVAFDNVDIIGRTGEGYTALVLNTTIEVMGAQLTVTFRALSGYAIINAIEVLEVIVPEVKTSVEEDKALQTLKNFLGLPHRFGWNGDPCAPQQHPWSGVDCQISSNGNNWVINGLGLDNQGLKGFLSDDIANLQHLQSINLSANNIYGAIPASLGNLTRLEILDLSFNRLNGSIPESLGQLTLLQILNLNGNILSGKVPANLGGIPLHGASFNFTGNAGLCGIPGLPSCGQLSVAEKFGIAFGVLLVILLLLLCFIVWWKRRENILRAQKLAAAREAPYAKARTHFTTRDVQMSKQHRPHEQSRTITENSPSLVI